MSRRTDDALLALNDACTQLLSHLQDLYLLPLVEQIRIGQEIEAFRNRLNAVDWVLLAAWDRADLAERLCQGNLRRVMTSTLSVSAAEAGRRVHAYEQLGERRSMLGEEQGPRRAVLAEAVGSGEVSAEKASIITRGLATVDRVGFDPADIDAGEKLLTDFAKAFGPKELNLLTQRVVDGINPDGTTPHEELNHDRRWFEMHPTKDGAHIGKFRLTAECGTKLGALLTPVSKVRVDQSGKADERTFGQRQHDGLEGLCDRLLRSGSVHDTGGVPVSVTVTIDEGDLKAKTGHATTSTGGLLSTGMLLAMAAEAEVIPAVLNAFGAVLELGRTKRCASRAQHLALIARDRGCSFPGCAHPAEFCERHHVTAWIDGGLTDLNNLTLLCRYHHHNFLRRGWQVRINGPGLPEWIPPKWLDRNQQPMINNRILAAHLRR